ncbi:DUF4212 domain-containing protein [Hyphomicrobium methylovorum]|uniref:sodium:solute symporter family transporter n=1 Tax=Hyphomicrobium methylovorum TaxID=84 RepID=UPI0015E69363|nr:sodium/substrate symporter small subunit [Hyphomicrobium methylovorum]MBA2126405.1 DUF4212 domain-containing protein [Hyphomicrobium methylovorum]
MGQGDISGASRPSRRLILISVAVWLVLVVGLPLLALSFNLFRVGGAPVGYWITAQGAALGLVALVLVYSRLAGGKPEGEGIRPALVFAGEIVGAAVLIGYTGYVAAVGYDGLALPLGLVGGVALLAILAAPRFVLYPVRSISGFFTVRYGGGAPRKLALIFMAAATVLILAADIKAGAYALQGVTWTAYMSAVTLVSLAVAGVWLLGSVLSVKRLAGLGFLTVLAGFLLSFVGLAVAVGSPLLHLGIGAALEHLANLSQTLIIDRLSDVKSLTPMASPFLQLPMKNFAGLLLAVALGLAVAPYLLGRHLSQSVVGPGDAVRRSATTLVIVAIVGLSLPLLAIYDHTAIESALGKAIETAALPQSFADASGLGWVQICGKTTSVAADIVAACGSASGHRGFLRLQDIAVATDGFVGAAPMLGGVSSYLQMPMALAALLASLLVGNALLAGLMTAEAESRVNGSADEIDVDFRALLVGALVVISASIVAAVSTTSSGILAAQGFALLAAGLFAPVVMGLHWRHMNRSGALAAMVVGGGIAALYLIGVELMPVQFFKVAGFWSDAAPEAAQRLANLEAAVLQAADPLAAAKANDALMKHAYTIANWWGLRSAAIVLIAVPAAIVAGILASLLARDPRRASNPV